ncbi:MAG: cohesin domain-containing protein, partial [Dehalococcoidia bacterium]
DSITVPVTVEGVPPGSPLAAATIEVRYDPAVLDATACNVDPGGIFDSGFCNPNFDNDGINPDAVRFNVTSVLGLSSDLLLTNITFKAVGQPGDTGVLNVSISAFADPDGNPVSVTGQDGETCLTPCDPDGDGWASADEFYMGTDPNSACASTALYNDEDPPDAWPVDFNDDQRAGMDDVIFAFVTTLAPDGLNQPVVGGLERVDLNGDGFISLQDVIFGYVTMLAPTGLNTTCSP